MKIRIKECLENSRIYEENGRLAGTIEGWPKNGPVREIRGTDGCLLYRVKREKGQCVVEDMTGDRKGNRAVIPFLYENRQAEGSGPAALFRAPLVVKAVIPREVGGISILQNRKREFTLEDETGETGRITAIASLNGHEIKCRKEIGIYAAAVLFVVAEYMYHDDDIEVV